MSILDKCVTLHSARLSCLHTSLGCEFWILALLGIELELEVCGLGLEPCGLLTQTMRTWDYITGVQQYQSAYLLPT